MTTQPTAAKKTVRPSPTQPAAQPAAKAPKASAKKTTAAVSPALARAVPPPKPLSPPAAKAAAKPQAKPAKTDPSPATGKPKKPKLVRDSFTIPKNEYEAIGTLKERAMKAGLSIKKSELLRAGLMTLAFMSDAAFAKALADVPTLKTGRPAVPRDDKKAK